MRAKRSAWGWRGAAVGLAIGLLLPAAARAVAMVGPISATTHFILGHDPYTLSDGNALDPGVNAPNVPLIDLSDATQLIKLSAALGDYSRVSTSTKLVGDSVNNATATNAIPFDIQWDLTWNGTIQGQSFQDYFECSEDCPQNFQLLFVQWDLRFPPFASNPSILGGFDVTSFVGVGGGPFLVDDTTANTLNNPSLDIAAGVGVTFEAMAQQLITFHETWMLGEKPNPPAGVTCNNTACDIPLGQSLFLYVGTPVPEPATALLALAGAAGLALAGRRRRA